MSQAVLEQKIKRQAEILVELATLENQKKVLQAEYEQLRGEVNTEIESLTA